jgi:AcrR family transcriptional regulator
MPTSRFLSDKFCPVRAKRERRKEARPGELLDAALDLFVEKGFAATRSEEVAARAGVSKGTLFLYFPSKEELFKAVVVENLSGRFTEWNKEFEEFEGTTVEMLRYCMRIWWERVGSTKASGLTKLMLSEGRNFPELAEFYRREVVQPGHTLLRRILRRGIDSGEFAPVDVDHAIYAVIAPMVFLMLWKHSSAICVDGETELDPEKYLEIQADTVLYGLTRRPPKAGA